MAWFPFARKRRKSKKIDSTEPNTAVDEKRGSAITSSVRSPRLSRAASPTSPTAAAERYSIIAVPYEDQTSGPLPVISSTPVDQNTAPRPPIHAKANEPIYAPPPESSLQTPPPSPPQSPTSAKAKPGRKASAEDITALPSSPRKVDQSSRLKTVQESDSNIFAGSTDEVGLTKRKSTKRRPDDSRREERVRVMSAPIPIPKRNGRESPQLFRHDSKRLRSELNRPLQDPTSTTSLPIATSARSSMTGIAESHRFDVGLVDMLSPRPTLRYSVHGHYASSAVRSSAPSRTDSKRAYTSLSRNDVEHIKTIDELADEMDSGSIRELMEREQRRKEKKRKAEEERARRRLEKYAARGEKESKAQEQSGAGISDQETDIAGVAGSSGLVREYPMEVHPALRAAEEREEAEAATKDPFKDPADEKESDQRKGPAPGGEGPFADPLDESVENVRDSQVTVSPPTSPIQLERDALESSQQNEPESAGLQDITETGEPTPRDPESRRTGGLAALLRRSWTGKRSSTDKGRDAPSERSFSNTSREDMAKQQSAAMQSTHDRTYRRLSSGTPVRRRSKFREELAESSVSSPAEAEAGEDVPPLPVDIGERARASQALFPDADRGMIDLDDPQGSATQPSTAVLSQSLASVDSEGSWLSGRPQKRTSQQLSIGRHIIVPKTSTTLTSTSTEDFFTPAEEYPQPMTPGGFFSATSEASYPGTSEAQTDVGSEYPESRIAQGLVARTPALVHREPRVQSSAALLGDFDEDDPEFASGPSQGAGLVESSRDASPDHGSLYEEGIIEDATTGTGVGVARKASHARQISAGSARLLDTATGTAVPITQHASHARQISAGSARVLDIPARRQSANLTNSPPNS